MKSKVERVVDELLGEAAEADSFYPNLFTPRDTGAEDQVRARQTTAPCFEVDFSPSKIANQRQLDQVRDKILKALPWLSFEGYDYNPERWEKRYELYFMDNEWVPDYSPTEEDPEVRRRVSQISKVAERLGAVYLVRGYAMFIPREADEAGADAIKAVATRIARQINWNKFDEEIDARNNTTELDLDPGDVARLWRPFGDGSAAYDKYAAAVFKKAGMKHGNNPDMEMLSDFVEKAASPQRAGCDQVIAYWYDYGPFEVAMIKSGD
jgi:hypothetical protein